MPKERIALSLVSPAFRLAYGAMAAVIALSAIVALPDYAISLPAAVLFALCALAALYEERWTFDAEGSTITFSHGLLFLARRRRWDFGDVAELRREDFERGFAKTPYTRIVLALKDGSEEVIESAKAKKAAKHLGTIERLSGYFKRKN